MDKSAQKEALKQRQQDKDWATKTFLPANGEFCRGIVSV